MLKDALTHAEECTGEVHNKRRMGEEERIDGNEACMDAQKMDRCTAAAAYGNIGIVVQRDEMQVQVQWMYRNQRGGCSEGCMDGQTVACMDALQLCIHGWMYSGIGRQKRGNTCR